MANWYNASGCVLSPLLTEYGSYQYLHCIDRHLALVPILLHSKIYSILLTVTAPDKRGVWHSKLITSLPNPILWVFIRIVSSRRF